jgi:hypothetical protein
MKKKPSTNPEDVALDIAAILTPADLAALEAGRITPRVLEFQNALQSLRDAYGVHED